MTKAKNSNQNKELGDNEWLKWRWEFMRRNLEYRNDYQKVKDLQQKAIYPLGSIIEKTIENDGEVFIDKYDRYRDTPEYDEEKKICRKYELRKMLNPDKTIEALLGKSERSSKKLCPNDEVRRAGRVQEWAKAFFYWHTEIDSLDSQAIRILNTSKTVDTTKPWYFTRKEVLKNIEPSLTLHIDFRKVNSVTALMKEVSTIIKRHSKAYRKLKEKKRLYRTDYDLILKIGDMKEKENMTYPEIAKIIFPDDFFDEFEDKYDEDGNAVFTNPECAAAKALQYHKRYQELVSGGYQNITYP